MDVRICRAARFLLCHKADRHDDTCQHCCRQHPECRLFVIQHVFYALFYTHLAKGNRTGCDHTAFHGAVQKCLRVCFFARCTELSDNFLIADQLNVPAQHDVGSPHQRIEPVDGQKNESGWFDQMVFSFQMRHLVQDYVEKRIAVNAVWNINARFDDPE